MKMANNARMTKIPMNIKDA